MCGKMRTLHSIWRVPVTCAGDGAGNQTHSLTHTPALFSEEGRLPLTLRLPFRRSPFQGKVVFPSHPGSLFRGRSSSPHAPVPFSPAPFSEEGRLPLTLRLPFQRKAVFPSHPGSLFRGRSSSPHTPAPFSEEGRLPLTLRLPFQGKVVFPSHPGSLFRGRSSSRRGAASGSEQARQRSPKTSGWIFGPNARACSLPLAAPLRIGSSPQKTCPGR